VKVLAGLAFAATVGIVPASAADSLSALRFLAGTWNCTYHAGKNAATYKATFAYDMSNNWMRERDEWAGGGSDLALFTYDPKRQVWTAVVIEPDRTITLFRATGSDANHIVYRSVHPDSTMTDVFDRTSPTVYTLHFTQAAAGKTTKSTDTCVKA
jgi:hypothetical protein